MSANRKRKSGMRRAYLKKTSHRYEQNPDKIMAETIGILRNVTT
jgi:hypothetical protein